jgi:hypothetical protein
MGLLLKRGAAAPPLNATPHASLRTRFPTSPAAQRQIPDKLFGVTRERSSSSRHGMSEMRPQPAQVTRKCV